MHLIFLTLATLATLQADGEITPAPTAPLPYEAETDHVWNWVIDGSLIGSTRVRIRPSEKVASEWILDARLRFSRAGRTIDSRSLTTFSGTSRRLTHYRREMRTGLTNSKLQSTVVTARFGTETTEVSVQKSSSPEIFDRNFTTGENPTILDSQCFEHWLLLAPNFPAERKGKIQVLVPTLQQSLELELEREVIEGEGADRLHRWNISHPTFEALIWVDEKGAVERYLQGDLDIQRQRVSPKPDPTEEAGEGG
ncbi:MAG TPA: hypothetical protein EYN79_10975 [Planctomycetes bacterium]|nr:hypothetical protein [Planctomycetota bacterium]